METRLRCEVCKRRIEVLSEEDAINDMEGHGWTNWQTANYIKCFDCANDNDSYETYYAGRIKRGYPNRYYMMLPDIKGGTDKLVECYTERSNNRVHTTHSLPTLKGRVSLGAD